MCSDRLSCAADDHDDLDSARPLTIAVFGDWPYNQRLLDNAALLIDSVNADREVSLAIHVGDIHSGSMPCTSAGILSPIPTPDPGWNQQIYFQFQQFRDPVVYTPGDNEWTDCHKAKESSSGDPLKEGMIHGTQAVPNLTRITVQGSTNKPAEWLRLTIDPRTPQVFSWKNIP